MVRSRNTTRGAADDPRPTADYAADGIMPLQSQSPPGPRLIAPHRRRRLAPSAAALAAITLITWSSPIAAAPLPAPGPSAPAAAAACTVVIGPDKGAIDGSDTALKGLKAGAVICLPAGTRPNLLIRNIHGTAAAPITIRNNGGVTRITGALLSDGGVLIQSSSDIRITGTGTEAHCGALYRATDQRCGIVIDGAQKGIKVDTAKGGTVGGFEFDHVEVVHTSQTIKTRGITIHPIPGLTVKGIHVHDNHVVETLAEGIYIGSEPHNQPYPKLGKVENVEIDHNLVERSGYDGIKLKVGLGSISIHDNVVHDAGQLGDPAHQGGIKTAFAGGDYYNNTIIGGVEGIRMDRVLPVDPTRYFNNLVVGVKSVGIQTSQDHAAIYNNTIVDSQGDGIKVTGAGSYVADNIIAGAAHPLGVRDGVELRNIAAATDRIGFVDPANGDYRLLATSAAVNAGPPIGRFPCGADDMRAARWSRVNRVPHFDHDRVGRPSGCLSDIGAFEYVPAGSAGPRASPLPE